MGFFRHFSSRKMAILQPVEKRDSGADRSELFEPANAIIA
jgi:hypothetical protein